jgi:predicted methyltransferase
VERAGAAGGEHLAAVGAADPPAGVEHRLAAQRGTRERELVDRVRPAVVGEQVVAAGVVGRHHVEPRDAV